MEYSELLKITDDPLAYVKEEIKKMNKEFLVGKVTFNLAADFNERIRRSDDEASSSTWNQLSTYFSGRPINHRPPNRISKIPNYITMLPAYL